MKLDNRFFPIAAAAFYLLAFPCSASAEDENPYFYRYHPKTVFNLGTGFSPNSLTTPKTPCISFQKRNFEGGALDSKVESYVVRDFKELMNTLEFDRRVEANVLFESGGSANGGFSKKGKKESMFSRDSVTLVIRGHANYGRIGLDSPTLLPWAQKLIDTGDFAEFEKTCGSWLVTAQHQGSNITVLITLTNLTSEEKSASETEINAGASFEIGKLKLGGSAKSTFEEMMKARKNTGFIEISAFSNGGEGIGSLGLLTSAIESSSLSGLSRIEEKIAETMKSFNFGNAAPTGYTVVPMPFGYKKTEQLWTQEQQNGLEEIADEYKELSSKMTILKAIANRTHPGSNKLSAGQLADVQAVIPKLRAYLAQLADLHRKCQVESTLEACQLPSPDRRPSIPDLESIMGSDLRLPQLKFLASPTLPGASPTDLEIEGDEPYSITVTMNGVAVNVKTQRSSGITLIPLGTYWRRLNGMFSGRVIGKIEIKDRFGGQHSRVFHVCQFSEITNDKFTNEFSREANLGK